MKFFPPSLVLAGTVGALCLSACAAQPQSAGTLQEKRHVENLATAERYSWTARNVDGQFQYCAPGQVTGSHIASTCVSEMEFESMFPDLVGSCPVASASSYGCGTNGH